MQLILFYRDCIAYLIPYVTMSKKTDHLAQVSDFEILIPHCSALFTHRNGESES